MAKYDIRNDKLIADGKAVDQIPSLFMGDAFAPTPKIIVIHFTGGGTARSSAEWFRTPRVAPDQGSSAHVVVDRDGSVIQCVPWSRIAWHAGKSSWKGLNGLNRFAFGIEIANFGALRAGAGGSWVTPSGRTIADPVLAVHKNGNPDGSRTPIGWEPYPPAQFDAVVGIARALVATFGCTEIVGHDDIAPTRKWDPGPAFDMGRFRALVLGGRGDDAPNHLRVVPDGGLNLRTGPGTNFPATLLLPKGSILEPSQTDGLWIEVTLLDAAGQPKATGWVHSKFVEQV